MTADLRNMDEITALAERGPFNILLNNAGMNRPQTFAEVDEATYDAVFDLNVRSAFFMASPPTLPFWSAMAWSAA